MNSPLRLLLILTLISLSATAQRMTREADDFLARLPAGLQARQEQAVRQAMAGDTELLMQVRASRNTAAPLHEGVTATDIGTTYRLYTPVRNDSTRLPVLIYLHGGGWCFGSINSCSAFCGALAKEARMAVLAVDYPLAPEHPYPAPLHACVEAVSFVHDNAAIYGFDTDAISAGGDSAGGNLALATAMSLPDSLRLKSLVLFYPVTKAWADTGTSWQAYGEGYGLDSGIMDAFNSAYAATADRHDPLLSPLCAPDSLLRRLPPTLIAGAGRDILLDQGREMYERMRHNGVDARREVFDGAVHLFITVPGQPTAFAKAVTLAARFLRGDDIGYGR